MPIASDNKDEVIEPRVGDNENNLTDSSNVTTVDAVTVVTETKVIETEQVNDPNPWRDTQAVRDANTLTEVPGRPWVVSYLKSVAGRDDVSDVSSESTTAVNQQFANYKDLTLKVQDPLSPTTNPESQVTTIEGSAIIQDVLTPSHGDHFVVELDPGRIGVLFVTSAKPQGIYKGRAYLIEYKVIELTTDQRLELTDKVIQTYHCRRIGREDNIIALTTDQYQSLMTSMQNIVQIEDNWTTEFYDARSYTYTCELNSRVHHDPLVSRFIDSIRNESAFVERYMDINHIRGDIFDSLLMHKLPTKLNRDLAKCVMVGGSGVRPRLARINYVGVGSVPETDDSVGGQVKLRSAVIEHSTYRLKDHWTPSTAPDEFIFPNPATFDAYLFDDKWWTKTTLSTLESQMFKHLTNVPTDEVAIAKLLNTLEETASEHERYFYGPIILFLAKVHYVKYG